MTYGVSRYSKRRFGPGDFDDQRIKEFLATAGERDMDDVNDLWDT
jgi:hypothetical protein